MAEALTLAAVRALLQTGSDVEDWFGVLRLLAAHSAFGPDTEDRMVRDLIIRALERRSELDGYGPLLDSIAVAAGLYPYADPSNLGVRDVLEYEAHRPIGFDDDIVFHRVQALVYHYLLNGESVILSAPTSFGKSLVIDALLASGRIRNAAVVVPTIALIDETRRRLAGRFQRRFKVVTHPQQKLGNSTVFVMTQERILDVPEFPELDLFVIDEFYKLDPAADRERAYLLNQAFYRLRRRSRQFYLLGPNIKSIPSQLDEIARIVVTDFATVALDTTRVDTTGGEEEALVALCSRLVGEPTIIFCKSPKQARDVANILLQRVEQSAPGDQVRQASEWASENYHPQWSFVKALAGGIGLHHGRLPRSLGQLVVRFFNQGDIKVLVCTSTLIEGVNTSAKNVVIFDNKIAIRKYDFFTFNNIRGRSGRMFSHFVGRVFLFHAEPDPRLRDVDFPVITQPDDMDESLSVQMEDEDLSDEARLRLSEVLDDAVLPKEDIRSSPGIDPSAQIDLARKLRAMSRQQLAMLSWQTFPTTQQLRFACDLIWEDLGGKRARTSYVRTAPQLMFRLNRLSFDGLAAMITDAVREAEEPDTAVEEVLEFARNWAGFNFPRLLMALGRIQRRVLGDRGMEPGNYAVYASMVETLFLPRTAVALEEYGVPIQVAVKLDPPVSLDGSLDSVLSALRELDLDALELTSFERGLVEDAIRAI